MKYYGSDKPDARFGMRFVELNDLMQHKDFKVFNEAELVVGIKAEGCGNYSRKQLDNLVDFVKGPHVKAGGLVYILCNADGTFKSSVDKFYTPEDLKAVADKFGAKPGDLIFYGKGKYISHVAIYIGGGQIIHASTAKTGIKVSNASYRQILAIRRIF